MIRQTHQVAPGGQARWAFPALLLVLAGCSVECHSSTSHSTSSSSGSERTVVHEHENEHKDPPRAQSGRGDAVRVVSTDKNAGGDPPADANGRGGDGTRHVVQPSGSAPPNHTEPERGSSSADRGADSGGAGGSSRGADSSGGANPADSGQAAGAAADQAPAQGKKPRTPSNKRESEPHVARPVKRRAAAKDEGKATEDERPVNKSEGRE
jgi:hypothetical protein